MSRSRLLPPSWPQDDSGFYCLLLHVPRPIYLTAGRLSGTHVEPGFALYVGRARKNLFARLARHMRRRKPRRWHIDYFFPAATPLGAFVLTDGGLSECAIADRLARRPAVRRIIPGFGASDCRCKGHLLWMPAGKAPVATGLQKVEFRPPLHLAGAAFFPAATW
ncbi:MAG: GIY-YIG nuclease family protein [Planctomycetes bacterium]|nr:GIY-YIG nuclease family protein [Planctomycetota bacterium]